MTRETRIGLLVGLVFIVMFGLILSELTRDDSPSPKAAALDSSRSDLRHAFSEASGILPPAIPPGAAPPDGVAQMSVRPPEHRDSGTVDSRMIDSGSGSVRQIGPPAGVDTGAAQGRGTLAAATPKIEKYTVQPNDSLIRIARKVYGRGHDNDYKLIFEANRDVLPDERTLMPGQVLVIPPLPNTVRRTSPAAGRRARPGLAAGAGVTEMDIERLGRHFASVDRTRAQAVRTYVVRRGDNLTRIARRELGDASVSAVRRLFEANRNKLTSPNRLPVGVELVIPG